MEAGIYFTSSPGYDSFGLDDIHCSERRQNLLLRLHDFWSQDVDSSCFFCDATVQWRFQELLTDISNLCGFNGHWVICYGVGPYDEAGGLAHTGLMSDTDSTCIHTIAHALGYLLQQNTIYYFIGQISYTSIPRGNFQEHWSEEDKCKFFNAGRANRPRAPDWTLVEGLGQTSIDLARQSFKQAGYRLCVGYQPRGSSFAMRLADDHECMPHVRVTLLATLAIDSESNVENSASWIKCAKSLRSQLPSLLQDALAQHAEPENSSLNHLMEWFQALGWSDAAWVLRTSSNGVIVRREFHPWYDDADGSQLIDTSILLLWQYCNQTTSHQ